MKGIFATSMFLLGAILVTGAALAGEPNPTALPEPVSLSLLAGGIVAIAAVKGLRRK